MGTPRSLLIDHRLAKRSLLEVLQAGFHLSRKNALKALHERRVLICGGVCMDGRRLMKAGQHVQVAAPTPVANAPGSPKLARQIAIRYIDEHIIVVDKPAGLTTVRHADEVSSLGHRAKKFLPQTLVDLLPAILAQKKLSTKGRIRAVHRIDKETSGLVVLARTPEAESKLGKQFRAHTVGRRYLALVRGQATDARIESDLVPDRGDGRRGSIASPLPLGEPSPVRGRLRGQRAITHVRVVEKLGDFTLVECELETGRTHQVRIHLGETGTPLCGERIYDRPLHGKPFPDESGAKRPLLHAAYLAIDHPATGKRMEWHEEMPEDMRELISDAAQKRCD